MDETKTETSSLHGGRIQPRRSSRSTISASPSTTKDDRNGSLPDSTASPTSPSSANNNTTSDTPLNTGTSAATAALANHHSRVTRSLSADSNSNEDSPNSNTTPTTTATTTLNQNGKRRRHTSTTKSSSKKKSSTTNATSPSTTNTSVSPSSTTSAAGGVDDYERETRNTTQRLSKEAKDARKAEREIIVKKKLNELELLEQKVKDQSHEEYQKLLEEIQSKRTKKLNVAKGRHALMEANFKNGFLAQKKSAFDKFHLDKLALRRKMMNHVQQQINRIEQEYFSSQQGAKSSLDEQNLIDWAPPDRPSMISSLTLGLDEQEISQDFTDLQDLLPTTTTTTTTATNTNTTQSIEECHPLDQSKKDTLPLIPSS